LKLARNLDISTFDANGTKTISKENQSNDGSNEQSLDKTGQKINAYAIIRP
jgi:hypothetical protein